MEMIRKHSIAMLLAVAATLPSVRLHAADPAPADSKRTEPVNPPKAAEPVKPGTIDKPPMAVAPGTMDAPPKPAAPGTLDKNVRNPDVEIKKGEKPIPK